MSGLFVPFRPLGRPPKYTPEELLQKFEEYLQDRTARPLVKKKMSSGFTGPTPTVQDHTEEVPHPISIRDFCVFCGCAEAWFRQLPVNFSSVTTRIQDYIADFQYKGAAAGFFQANIIARQLGLADKVDASVSKTTTVKFVEVDGTRD